MKIVKNFYFSLVSLSLTSFMYYDFFSKGVVKIKTRNITEPDTIMGTLIIFTALTVFAVATDWKRFRRDAKSNNDSESRR